MVENTKTKYSDLQELMECCSNTVLSLSGFHEQIIKVIEAKNKVSASANSDVAFNQANVAISTVANLKNIDSNVSGAINKVQQLGQQVQLLQSALGQSNVNVAKLEEKAKR